MIGSLTKLSFGDLFHDKFFDGNAFYREQYLMKYLQDDCVSKCRQFFESLVMTEQSKGNITKYSSLLIVHCYDVTDDKFFILPTSTGGKYHGGRTSWENCVGGMAYHIQHILDVIPLVCHRYANQVDDTFLTMEEFKELLTVCAFLHDMGRFGEGKTTFSLGNHGEYAAELFMRTYDVIDEDLVAPFVRFFALIRDAIFYHMEVWRSNVTMKLEGETLMVAKAFSECDYFSLLSAERDMNKN